MSVRITLARHRARQIRCIPFLKYYLFSNRTRFALVCIKREDKDMKWIIAILVLIIAIQTVVSYILLDRAVSAEKMTRRWRRAYEEVYRVWKEDGDGNQIRGGTVWQITLDEITEEAFKPNGSYNWRNGITDWLCPLCGGIVGIHSNGKVHEEGWLYKKDECKYGHKVDWDV